MHEIAIHPTAEASAIALQNAIEVRFAMTASWPMSEVLPADICINAICTDAQRVSLPLQNFVVTENPSKAWHSTCIDVVGTDAEMQPIECEGPLRAGDQTVIAPGEGDHCRLPVFFEFYCEIGKASRRRLS
jgi:hypothetical protein